MSFDDASLLALSLARDISYAKASVLVGDGEISWTRRESYVAGYMTDLPVDLRDGRTEPSRLATLLHYGAGLLRWEPDYGFRAHRAFPSPRAAYASEVYVIGPPDSVAGDGVHHFQATQHRLRRVSAGDAWNVLGTALGTCLPADALALVVATDFSRLTPRYGDFAYALCTMEAGHAVGNLVHVADCLGYRPSVQYRFPDDVVRALIGCEERPASPVAVIILHDRAGLERGGGAATDAPAPRVAPLVEVPGARRITAVERAVAQSALRDRVTCGIPASDNRPAARSLPVEERAALQARNSGWGGYSGELNPHPTSIDAELLFEALRGGSQGVGDDLGDTTTVLGHYAIAIRFDGVAPGVYRLEPERDVLQPIVLGDVRDQLRRAYTYSPDRANIHSAAGVVALTVDYHDAIARWGPRGHRIVNMLCGQAAQRMCLSAGRRGYFGRPVRAFLDAALEELLRLTGSSSSAVYAVVFGANRYPVLSYNLAL